MIGIDKKLSGMEERRQQREETMENRRAKAQTSTFCAEPEDKVKEMVQDSCNLTSPPLSPEKFAGEFSKATLRIRAG